MHILSTQAALWVLLAMVGSAAVTDLRTGLIPNRIVALGALAGVMVQLLAVVRGLAPWSEVLLQMSSGFVVCSLVPALLYAAGALGGGDLKLFAAIGICVGPSLGLDIQVWSHVLAVAFLPLYLARSHGFSSALRTTGALIVNAFRPHARRTSVQLTSFRFAPAIFAATLWVLVVQP